MPTATKESGRFERVQSQEKVTGVLAKLDLLISRLSNMRDVLSDLAKQKKLPDAAAGSLKSGLEQAGEKLLELAETL